MGKSITSISKKTIDTLAQWDWPGNVRELKNFMERSVILTHGSVLVAALGELSTPREYSGNGNGNGNLQEVEREHVLRALRESRGRISGGPYGAAERLGLKRTTLQSKLKEMRIDRRRIVDEN
jgi:formate hydrogenlyase transcriptional activator